jgi:hypothetical protein
LPAAHGEHTVSPGAAYSPEPQQTEAPAPPTELLPAKPPAPRQHTPTPCAHPKPLHHGKSTPNRSEPSRCVIASSWSKSCPRASLPGLHDSNSLKPYICFCTRGYPCLRANTHTHTRVPGWQEAPSGLENRHHLAHHALSCACLALCSLPSPSIIPHCDAPCAHLLPHHTHTRQPSARPANASSYPPPPPVPSRNAPYLPYDHSPIARQCTYAPGACPCD